MRVPPFFNLSRLLDAETRVLQYLDQSNEWKHTSEIRDDLSFNSQTEVQRVLDNLAKRYPPLVEQRKKMGRQNRITPNGKIHCGRARDEWSGLGLHAEIDQLLKFYQAKAEPHSTNRCDHHAAFWSTFRGTSHVIVGLEPQEALDYSRNAVAAAKVCHGLFLNGIEARILLPVMTLSRRGGLKEILKDNVIIIGGPNSTPPYRHIFKRYRKQFPYRLSQSAELIEKVKNGKCVRKFKPSKGKDLGFTFKIAHPDHPSKTVCAVVGLGHRATLGCAILTLSQELPPMAELQDYGFVAEFPEGNEMRCEKIEDWTRNA